MKFFAAFFLCFFAFQVHGSQHENLIHVLSMKNLSPSNISEISFIGDIDIDAHNGVNNLLSLNHSVLESNSLISSQVLRSKNSNVKAIANSVSITSLNGFTYHVADYYGAYGHSRIVTCLDGSMRGHQSVADNGVIGIESNDVEWHQGYFVHRYPKAKVYSYPNKQMFEIK